MATPTALTIINARSFHITETINHPAIPKHCTRTFHGNKLFAVRTMPTMRIIDDTHLIYQSIVCVGVTVFEAISCGLSSSSLLFYVQNPYSSNLFCFFVLLSHRCLPEAFFLRRFSPLVSCFSVSHFIEQAILL